MPETEGGRGSRGSREGDVMKFKKKPIVVEAVLWDGANIAELKIWGAPVTHLPASMGGLIIGTLEDGPNFEAVHVASRGDWIVKGIKGEFYPCKPDIFEATYEPVHEGEPT